MRTGNTLRSGTVIFDRQLYKFDNMANDDTCSHGNKDKVVVGSLYFKTEKERDKE